MISKLRAISVSDIHLGHRKTPTQHIVRSLRAAFRDSEAMENVDVIFIVGDLFDGPLQHHSEAAVESQLWIFDFLRMCAKRNIIVRVLEGTRSHDWKQSVWLTVVKAIGEINVDLKWVQTLSIEYIEKLDATVLYVPDEWRTETDQTWLEVNQLLAEKGLEKVDFTLLHGAFDKQMPEFVDCQKHNSERYSSITRMNVFAGHIHKSWSYLNILGNGSFDRLAHGEEEPKGYWLVDYRDGVPSAKFVINEHSMIYKTIVCDDLDIDAALKKIERETKGLADGSHLRIQSKSTDTITHAIDQIKKTYRQFQWETKTSDAKTSQAKMLVDHRPVNRHVAITADNFRSLMMERLGQMSNDYEVLEECGRCFDEMGYK